MTALVRTDSAAVAREFSLLTAEVTAASAASALAVSEVSAAPVLFRAEKIVPVDTAIPFSLAIARAVSVVIAEPVELTALVSADSAAMALKVSDVTADPVEFI